MIKYIYVLFSLFIFLISSHSQKEVKVGVFNYYPAVFKDIDGSIKGFYVDALNEIEEKENLKFIYVFGTWSEGLERIKNSEVDVLTSVAITEERLKFMDYTNTPLLTVWSEVYIKEKSEINGILDLNGKKVAFMKSDYNAIYFKQYAEKLSIINSFEETNDFDQVFALIANGKVDAGIVNNIFGASKSRDYRLVSSGIVLNPFDIYFTVKKDTNVALLNLLNTYLQEWKHDKSSVFNVARQNWSHGSVGVVEVFPKWLLKSVYVALLLILLLIIFNVLLRYRVKRAQEKFNIAIEFSPIPTVIASIEGKILLFNKQFIKTYGYTIQDIPTIAKWFEIAYPDLEYRNFVINDWNHEVENSLKNSIPVEAREYKVTCKNGDVRYVAISVSFEKNIIIALFQDITENKKAEQDLLIKNKEYEALNEELTETNLHLQISKAKAEESDRLKTAFLQNMSHEIRTPMNAIMGFSGLIPRNFNNLEKLENFSRIIELRCNDLLAIINDILDISKIESGQSVLNEEIFDINELFDELKVFFQDYKVRINKQKIKLTFHQSINESENFVTNDRLKLKQIIINLVSNALKFTESGSIDCGYKIVNGQIHFHVSDTGIGIPADKHEYIFERFSQIEHPTFQNIGGTGLGLSIVKGLVKMLGGDIWLESECNKGTTFYFTIQFKQTYENNIINSDVKIINEFITDKTILIVEDDFYNAEYLKEILSTITSNILVVTNGFEAVKMVQEQKIALILMDIRLPDINGYEATRMILQNNPAIKIIAQTAYASNTESIKAMEAGCVDYISKPTKQDQLLNLISRHLQ